MHNLTKKKKKNFCAVVFDFKNEMNSFRFKIVLELNASFFKYVENEGKIVLKVRVFKKNENKK